MADCDDGTAGCPFVWAMPCIQKKTIHSQTVLKGVWIGTGKKAHGGSDRDALRK